MTILKLQRRLTEIGRLRLGHKVPTRSGKMAPAKLATWRATSASQDAIEAIADIYGGEVKPWKPDPKAAPQFEVITTSTTMDIIVTPGQTLSQAMEMWGGSECRRRCDGEREFISDGPCLCPADEDERRDMATQGKACKPTSRLSVMLKDVPALGLWRVESHGWNSAVELSGAAEILEQATRRGKFIPATLRLDQRTSRRNGETFRFAVPVIDIKAPIGLVLESIGVNMQEIGSGSVALASPPPMQALPARSIVAPVLDARQEQEGDGRREHTPEPSPITPEESVEVPVPSAPPGWKPIPEVEEAPIDAEVVAEQILNVKAPGAGRKPRSNAAEPIKSTGLKPRGRPVSDDAPKKPAFPQFAINQPNDQYPAVVEAPSGPSTDVEAPAAGVVGGEAVATPPPLDDPPIPLAPTQPARDPAPLTLAQQIVLSAKRAGLDDDVRHDLIEMVTKGRTRSSTEIDDNEAGSLHLLFSELRRGKKTLSYTPDGKAVVA